MGSNPILSANEAFFASNDKERFLKIVKMVGVITKIGERTVERSNDKIIIKRMDVSRVPSDFIRAMYEGTSRGYSSFDIEIENPESPVFPNACTPISAIIEYYKYNGIEFSFSNIVDNYLFKCKFESPQEFLFINW